MKNIFYNDNFYYDIKDLIETCFDNNKLDLPNEITVELSTLESVFDVNVNDLAQLLADNNEDRLNINNNDEEEEIIKALNDSIDFNKLNSLLPLYNYPNDKFVKLTKEELKSYL